VAVLDRSRVRQVKWRCRRRTEQVSRPWCRASLSLAEYENNAEWLSLCEAIGVWISSFSVSHSMDPRAAASHWIVLYTCSWMPWVISSQRSSVNGWSYLPRPPSSAQTSSVCCWQTRQVLSTTDLWPSSLYRVRRRWTQGRINHSANCFMAWPPPLGSPKWLNFFSTND